MHCFTGITGSLLRAPRDSTISRACQLQLPAAQAPDINSGRNLIDAVNWDVISQLHGTRAPKACRQKWYDNLAPSMVSRGRVYLSCARLRRIASL